MTKDFPAEAHLARIERLCSRRKLTGLSRMDHKTGPAISVADTHFAVLVDHDVLALACPVDQKVLLMDISPSIYFETEAHLGKPLILIRLDAIDDEELSLRLDDAWTALAPESLKAARPD